MNMLVAHASRRLLSLNAFRMGMLTDKLADKQNKKSQEEFRK